VTAFLALDLAASAIAAQAATPIMPTFYARRDYQVAAGAPLQIADANGDGIPDVIADGMGNIQVLLGNGNGTFSSAPNTKTILYSSYGFAAQDLNGDGIADLVLVGGEYSETTSGIAVCIGKGDGTFSSGTFYQAGSGNGMEAVTIGDFNGDGIPDVIAVGNGAVWFFAGQGGGAFSQPVSVASTSTNPMHVVSAELNGDSNLDLVVTLQSGGFIVLFGNGNGTFQSPLAFSQPGDAFGLAVGSLTKGGPPGIVLGDGDEIYIYFGNGAGTFSGPYTADLQNSTGQIAIGDVNGDGIPDIVTAHVNILFGEGGGKFSKPFYYPIEGELGPGATSLVLADLRSDGLTDIVTDGFGISVLLSESKGLYEDGIWTSVIGGAGCGVAADFNGVGKPDLAVNTPSGISILLGTGKYLTPFTAGTNIALAGADCLVTGDINGDGKPDLLVPVSGTVVAYLGNGDGTFTLTSTVATPSGGYLAVGDFNHDGKLDFATSGNLIALGNGDGTFQSPTDTVADPPEGGFAGIAAGDINNHGWTDLLLTSNAFPVDADATVLLNNQQGGFTQVPTAFGALSYEPVLADLNGDGKLDLILSYTGGLAYNPVLGASIYLGNGGGALRSARPSTSRPIAPPLIWPRM